MGLFSGDRAKCHGESEINCMGRVKDIPDNLLDLNASCLVVHGGCVFLDGLFCFSLIFSGRSRKGAVFWLYLVEMLLFL